MKPTVEELMAMVEKRSQKKLRIENHPNVIKYIEEAKIEVGTELVPTYVIFWHYRTKFPGGRDSKAKKITFFRTFNKRFPHMRHGTQRFYLMKEGLYPMDDTSLKEAKAYDKHFWSKKEKAPQSVEEKYSI